MIASEEDIVKGSVYEEGQQQLHLTSFIRDVNYSCGSCGYELNLNSSNRNTYLIDSNYVNSIKKGFISFFSIDQSRFTQIQQLPLSSSSSSWSWIPFSNSNCQWRRRLGDFFQRRRRRMKLLCRSCQNHIGYAADHHTMPSRSWDGISDSRIFYIKLNALQPSFCHHHQPSLTMYHTASSLVF